VQEHVEWLWGFRLFPWQLEDVLKTLGGGVYALMYATDHGKSMEIEIDTVLDLIRNPNSRNGIIKINDSAAMECAEEIARKLEKASVRYPEVKPMVQWRNEQPHGISKGFWVAGADHQGRNINRSVRCYGLGSRDLQGKRFRTKVDDIETEQEAMSAAMRTRLEARLDSVLRTLEADAIDEMGLWAVYGTPQHDNSVYHTLPSKLSSTGVKHEIIRRPAILPDGTYLMPSRAAKIEVHRATMSKAAFAAAYDLRPLAAKRPTPEQIETLVKHRGFPIPANEKDFREWLWIELSHFIQDRQVIVNMMADLSLYIGWDPATTGEWASGVIAKLQRHTYALRAFKSAGADTYDQVAHIHAYVEDFPSAEIVLEKNAEQRAFKDVYEQVYPDEMVYEHGTFGNKEHGNISIPAMVAEMREGFFHIPWQDDEDSEVEFGDVMAEVNSWSMTAHPHIIPAYWFCWHRHNKYGMAESDTQLPAGTPETVQIIVPRPVMPLTLQTLQRAQPVLRQRSADAWARRH
jgi:hypothetical protein